MGYFQSLINNTDMTVVTKFVEDHATKAVDNKVYNWLGDHGPFSTDRFADKCVANLEASVVEKFGSVNQRLFTKRAQSRAANVLFWGAVAWMGSGQALRLLSAVSTLGILAVAAPAAGVLAINFAASKK